MKKILFCLMSLIVAMPTYAAPTGTTPGRAIKKTYQRAMQGSARTGESSSLYGTVSNSGAFVENTGSVVDKYKAEREVCLKNNIAASDIFVWASRNSNTDNYSMMVEDIYNPANNVCFVLVKLRSNDGNVNLTDIQGKYFPMGTRITCGEWVNRDKIEKRILDAKKSSRTWATVAGSIGGAGVGVGSMELFGNKLIGGAVQGQKALEGDDLFLSQLLVLKKDKDSRYDAIVEELKQIKEGCEKDKIPECDNIDYAKILEGLGEK